VNKDEKLMEVDETTKTTDSGSVKREVSSTSLNPDAGKLLGIREVIRRSESAMRHHRDHLIEQQRQLMAVMRQITGNADIRSICRLVRDAMVELKLFDRAGIWTVDGSVLGGTWGTDTEGQRVDESNLRMNLDEFLDRFPELRDQTRKFFVNRDVSQIMPSGEIRQLFGQAVIPIRLEGALVAILMVDNLLSMKQIAPPALEVTLLFCEQVTEAIGKARLAAERAAAFAMQRRLTELAVALASESDADNIFRLIRDEITALCAFDRAAVWVIRDNVARGTWGTDELGRLADLHSESFELSWQDEILTGECLWRITPDHPFKLDDGRIATCPHALIPMWSGDSVVGLLTVDNLLTQRPITNSNIDEILPVVQHAAIAFDKAKRLHVEKEVVKTRQRLLDLAVAVNSVRDPVEILRIARNAIVETRIVDRVRIWRLDEDGFRGTWGTDLHGNIADEHEWLVARSSEFFCELFQRISDTKNRGENVMFGEVQPNESGNEQIPYASFGLWSEHELVGLICVDNLITSRPIRTEDLEPLLPFIEQVAVAIRNTRLLQMATDELAQRKIVEEDLLRQGKELLVARDQALAGSRARDQFLANMSHELRTPLNGVIGMAALLEASALDPLQVKQLRVIQGSAGHLLSIIDSILDFANFEFGEVTFTERPFDLRGLAESVAESAGASLINGPVDLTCSVAPCFPDRVVGDSGRLRQVTVNLVDNAIKFTPSGRVTLELSVAGCNKTHAQVRISVSDTGLGISEEHQSRIFEGFSQADASNTRVYGGLGVGLAICKRIVDRMGGTLRMRSIEGSGSTFWVDLNLEVENGGETQPSSWLDSQNILVVSPNHSLRIALFDQLRFWGATVFTTDDLAKCNPSAHSLLIYHHKGDSPADSAVRGEISAFFYPRTVPTILVCHPTQLPFAVSEFDGVLPIPCRRGELQRILQSVLSHFTKRDSSTPDLNLNVLLAEDNMVNAIAAQGLLEQWGSRVTWVENGAAALTATESELFDVVLMDISMPIMDGLEATLKIREVEKNTKRRIPIIALTAHATSRDRDLAFHAGMDDYLTKPINPDEMLERLRFWQNHLTHTQPV